MGSAYVLAKQQQQQVTTVLHFNQAQAKMSYRWEKTKMPNKIIHIQAAHTRFIKIADQLCHKCSFKKEKIPIY